MAIVRVFTCGASGGSMTEHVSVVPGVGSRTSGRSPAPRYGSPMPPSRQRSALSGAVLAVVVAVSGCTGGSDGQDDAAPPTSPETTTGASPTTTRPSTPPPTRTTRPGPRAEPIGPQACVTRTLTRMSMRARAAQLLMVGVPADATAPPDSDVHAVAELGVGSVILHGRSSAGVDSTAALTAQLQQLARGRSGPDVGLEVAADQEGGQVQVLSGPGLSAIPDAEQQGRLAPAALRRAATGWGRELAAAGVTVNLAPVADTVPAGTDNDPIGDYDRQYGSMPGPVGASAAAFARGMLAAGVAPVAKHFPGLGQASGNTDTAAGVVDDRTTRDDPYLRPFREVVAAGAPYVMMATATYRRIDPDRLAAFSPRIVTGMLRGDLGFEGLIVSDDVGIAASVADLPVGQRATRFVAAGGDVVLTVVPEQAPAMVDALARRAGSSERFARTVTDSARLVLERKASAGLLRCG